MKWESTSAVIRPDLQAVAQEFLEESFLSRFVGRLVAPLYSQGEASGEWPIIRRGSARKRTDDSYTAAAGFKRITTDVGQGSFKTEHHGIEHPMAYRDIKKFRSLFDAEAAAIRRCLIQVMLNHEYLAAALYAASGATNHNVATAWTTVATAAPLTDIKTGLNALQDVCGAGPEDVSLIIPRVDFDELLRVTEIAAKTLYTYPGIQPGYLKPQQIANMLGVKRVIVCSTSVDTAEEGVTESLSQLWTGGVMYLAVLPDDEADMESLAAARTVVWDQYAFPQTESYQNLDHDVWVPRVRADYDVLLTAATDLAIYKITNT